MRCCTQHVVISSGNPSPSVSSHVTITLVLIAHSLVTPTAYLPWDSILAPYQSQSWYGPAWHAYSVWCPSSYEPEEEDEGVRDPNFKLHTASFSDVPKVCTEWRDPGYRLDASQHVEDTDRELKRRPVEY